MYYSRLGPWWHPICRRVGTREERRRKKGKARGKGQGESQQSPCTMMNVVDWKGISLIQIAGELLGYINGPSEASFDTEKGGEGERRAAGSAIAGAGGQARKKIRLNKQ